MSENKNVMFDEEVCRANPEAAANRIAELESDLQSQIISNEIMADRLKHVENSARTGSEVAHERDFLAMEARRYAGHYPESSDGRNTFILFAEMIERRENGR